MKRITAISPDQPAAGGAGAVLRGIALHREPRLLPHALRQSTRPTSANDGPSVPGAPFRREPDLAAATRDAAVEEALTRGHEAGIARGLEEGRRQGLEEGREAGRRAVERNAESAARAIAERLATLDTLLASLPAELSRRLEGAEDDMVALCHAAVCRILGERLATREAVVETVREALRAAGCGPHLHAAAPAPLAIHVHPRNLELLRSDERIAVWLGPAHEGLRWVADEAMQLGGCIVSTGEGSLDARLETQLAALRDVLTQRRTPATPGSEA